MNQVQFDFTDKRFVVTGATSGMGRQVAMELVQSGGKILAIARGLEALTSLQATCPSLISIASCDVTNAVALEEAVAAFVATHGKLNGSVHAAGISGMTPVKSFDKNLAEHIMSVSFWAGIDIVRLATKAKYAEHGSSHVLFSSVSSYTGEKGMFAYSAAKAALRIGTRSLAKEISSKGHRANTVSPGWVTTKMTIGMSEQSQTETILSQHLLGAGHPEDVSGMVLFLLSDRARWITGADFVVDGGYLA